METDHLLTVEMVAVVSELHPLAKHNSIDFNQFLDHELVMFKSGYFHREFIEKASECCKAIKFSFETNLLTLILSIVKHEFAITALLDLVTENETGVVGVLFAKRTYGFGTCLAKGWIFVDCG